ncbi:MAG: tRNA 2-thiouridine(34) synthase MnmA [Rubrobacteridae bacterium]|nr:tRNA 2-thiouridine(34) synthase MnmA [Rubrobacteridae bacterium]
MNKKVVCAMSGGVDSSVAAALLIEAGYDVIGITMNIWPSDKTDEEAERFGGCCSITATDDAKRVAHKLGIPHYTFDFREIFRKEVISDFVEEYTKGRTPNPCIKCNQFVKFQALLHKSMALGADCLATGHYARIEFDSERSRYVLRKGIDTSKDQSYFLYTMTQEQLSRTLFPVGHLEKHETRKIANELGLNIVAGKPESQEICFVPDNIYPRFVAEYSPGSERPGPVYDKEGNILGTHKGIIHYTIGQRKGLGISWKEPLYVISIREEEDALVVGTKQDLLKSSLLAKNINLIAMEKLEEPMQVKAKIRYKSKEARAIIYTQTDTYGSNLQIRCDFEQPQSAITTGQAVVFYSDDLVVGGGTIDSVADVTTKA